MTYPFYTWLSLIGVLIQYVKTTIQIFTARPLKYANWMNFFARFMGVLLGFIMVPIGLMLLPLNAIMQRSALLGNLWDIAILVVLYLMGVLAARNLYRWSKTELEDKGTALPSGQNLNRATKKK